VTTERSLWGGLRHEKIADLEISRGENLELAAYEERVARVIDGVLATGPERLSRFRERIGEDREENSERFEEFRKAVADAIRARGWFTSPGLPTLIVAGVVFAAAGAILLWIGIERFESFAPRWADVLLLAFGACALLNAVVIAVALYNVSLWRRRNPKRSRRPSAGTPSGAT
jgi:hypothetical protein